EEVAKLHDVKVLHSGTKRDGEKIITSGGRVLGVTATGDSLDAALERAYEAASKIHFDGMHYRRDIGRHGRQSSAAGDGPGRKWTICSVNQESAHRWRSCRKCE